MREIAGGDVHRPSVVLRKKLEMNRPTRKTMFKRWLTLAIVAGATCAYAADGWSLVWADEFNQADGAGPDPARWVLELGGQGWGNNELQSYTDRRTNSWIENGRLILAARQESFTGTDGIHRAYTSARLKTLGKASWTFGRFEARIKLPYGQGIWPAFWLLGTNFPTIGWPRCGEIDIMENIGREPNVIHGTVHGPGYSGQHGITGAVTNRTPVAGDFHVYAVEWQADQIAWFLDGERYFQVTPQDLPDRARWVFTHPFYLILNLAVGGQWPGAPDATTKFPQRMEVDYVRVYARTDSNSPTSRAPVTPTDSESAPPVKPAN